MNESQCFKITHGKLLHILSKFILYNVLPFFYTYSCTTIPHKLLKNNLSVFFFIYILLSYLSTIPIIIEIYYTYKYLGKIMNISIWKTILPTYKYPTQLLRFLPILTFVLGCYFMLKFIPISTNNCDIYTNVSTYVCISFQIISIVTIIYLFIGSFFIFIICLILPTLLINYNRHLISIHQSQNHQSKMIKHILSYIPFMKSIDNKNCMICSQTHDDKQEKWIILICHHQFHYNCLTQWLMLQKNCPICHKSLEIDTIV